MKGKNKGNNKHPNKAHRAPLQEQIDELTLALVEVFKFLELTQNRLVAIETFLTQHKAENPVWVEEDDSQKIGSNYVQKGYTSTEDYQIFPVDTPVDSTTDE